MLLLRNTPLRRKLQLLITVPGTVMVFVVGLAVLVLLDEQSRQDLRQRTREAVALVVPQAAESAALGSLDTYPLRILRLLPGFAGVVVWDAEGNAKVKALEEGLVLPERPSPTPGERLERGRLLVWRSFFDQEGDRVGTLCAVVDLQGVQNLLWYRGGLLLLLTLVTAGTLWGSALWLQRIIAEPILALRALQGEVDRGLPAVTNEGEDEIAQLVKGYHHLLSELGERESELRQSQGNAAEAQRIKGLYLAGVSHELRTPLMSILSYAEAVVGAEGVPESLAEDMRHMGTAGRHLLQLIEQILDLSKLEAGRVELKLEEIPVAQLVQEALSTIEPLVRERGDTLEVHLDGGGAGGALGTLSADLTRCRQILLNLLSNAVAYTHEGRIAFRVWREAGPRCDRLFFQVTDDGIGITPQQMDRLFEPFAHGEEGSTGAGLGLAISRQFARLMGGDITVSSEPGAGASFTLRLPVEVLPAGEEDRKLFHDTQEGPLHALHYGTVQRPRVLVLDEDPDGGEVLEAMLSREGFRVRRGDTEEDALRRVQRLAPALILLAVKVLPQRGWAFLSQLKADPQLAQIPVIVVSPLDERDKALHLGAVDLLVKPFDRKRLAAAIDRCMGEQGGPTALVVEDDPAAREMLRRCLERVGWKVTEADQGVAALRSVSEFEPQLIVLDLMLPEMDGFAFLRELRKIPERRDTAILVITGRDLLFEEERSLGPVLGILRKGAWTLEELRLEVINFARSQRGRWTAGEPNPAARPSSSDPS